MKLDPFRASFFIILIPLLSGCALLSPARTEINKYVLNTIPSSIPIARPHSATLLVLPPQTASIYASTRMLYTSRAYQIEYFSENEWAATPEQMIQPLIINTLRSTRYFSNVMSPPDYGSHTFVLRTDILELRQDFTADPAILKITIRFDLSREAASQVIATKEFSVREPMQARTPYAGVVAANEALGKVLRDLAIFVIENVH
ncbi:ABC-type transport auxiliary lipoprotein family protein [Cupriavidus basilensis]|uniref:ABC-type transport auxiliary lipoprotein family protein n=1 Tax=Cupriavidus basilensis TaxID=68895 RepID=A0ABT6AH35_9BURK|nr:ABC-type transport auxiliary lipoprotein family protein [Cupriavidus basilensis]MDF3831910.1 ABC-type transport auxiliary lipoprotein family protein [Cupriavidus basilensis]